MKHATAIFLLAAIIATRLNGTETPLIGGLASPSKQEVVAPVVGLATPVWREAIPGAHIEITGRFTAPGPEGSILLRVGGDASPQFSLAWDAAENNVQFIQPGSLPPHAPAGNTPAPGAREMTWRVVLRPLAQPARAVVHTFKQGKWQAAQSFDLPPWQGAQQWVEEGGIVFAGVANAALANVQVKTKVDGTLFLVR